MNLLLILMGTGLSTLMLFFIIDTRSKSIYLYLAFWSGLFGAFAGTF